MVYALYSFGLALCLLALAPYFLYLRLRHKKYVGSLKERLGWIRRPIAKEQPTIWVHAVSIGEALAIQSLVARLHEDFPTYRIVLSTTTTTGQEIARKRFSQFAEVIYFPLDFSWCVRRTLDAIHPSLVLIVETEIWPNFLRACHQRGIPVLMVNGRISDDSFRGYHRLRFLIAPILDHFTSLLMQSKSDAGRIMALGAPSNRVHVTGNLKYDLATIDLKAKTLELTQLLSLDRGRLIVAGSTAKGEEEMVLDAFAQLIDTSGADDLRLLLAPRHPERFDEVEDLIRQTGLSHVRRSHASGQANGAPSQVILLDTVGELMAAYASAEIVFVGGSLVPQGGHNILEPALFGKPIIVGPYTSNFRAIISQFAEEEAILQISPRQHQSRQEELIEMLSFLLQHPDRGFTLGQRARQILDSNRGATERTLAHIRDVLGPNQPRPPVDPVNSRQN